MGRSRLEAFSDGVFAVAITLLALALVVALFSAVASFVLIALVAVYYVLENTPVYPAPDRSGDDETVA